MHGPTKQIVVYKGRTTTLNISMGFDVSGDTITSEIREGKDFASTLIAAWTVAFETDGVDGELVLTLDNTITSGIDKTIGYMDLKRVTSGEPVNVFDDPLEVLFKNTITA